MVDRLDSLRHYAIIRRNYQYRYIRALRASCSHGRKSFVPGRVQECNFFAACVYGISTDMLGNTACFASRNMGLTNRVQQGGFAMIHMAHNSYNRRTNRLFSRIIFNFRNFGRIFFRWQWLYIHSEFVTNQRCCVKIDVLVDCYHFP